METRITAPIITTTITTTTTTTSAITTTTSVADLTITVTGQVLTHALHASHRRTATEMLQAQAQARNGAMRHVQARSAASASSASSAAPAADRDAATPASDLATSTRLSALLDPPATASAAKRDKGWLWYWDYDALAWAKYSIRESDSSDDDDEQEPSAQITVPNYWTGFQRPQPKSRPTPPNTPPAKKTRG
jgi:hypothetical protein